MSRFASFADYPARSLVGAEAALLTAWASLERFHDDLVLVGGLAVKYLSQRKVGRSVVRRSPWMASLELTTVRCVSARLLSSC